MLSDKEQIELTKLDVNIQALRDQIEDYQKERRTILMRSYQRNHRAKVKEAGE